MIWAVSHSLRPVIRIRHQGQTTLPQNLSPLLVVAAPRQLSFGVGRGDVRAKVGRAADQRLHVELPGLDHLAHLNPFNATSGYRKLALAAGQGIWR